MQQVMHQTKNKEVFHCCQILSPCLVILSCGQRCLVTPIKSCGMFTLLCWKEQKTPWRWLRPRKHWNLKNPFVVPLGCARHNFLKTKQNYPEKNSPETPVPPLSPAPGGQDCHFSQAGTWHGLSLLRWMSLNASGCAAVYLIIHEELL